MDARKGEIEKELETQCAAEKGTRRGNGIGNGTVWQQAYSRMNGQRVVFFCGAPSGQGIKLCFEL